MTEASAIRQLSALTLVLVLTGCGGGGGGGGGGGTSNSAPRYVGQTNLTFAETESVTFTADVADADGDTVTVTIGAGGDGGLFVLDTSTGIISANTPNALLDFENPRDANADNVYEQTFTLSDGKVSVNETIRITITNVDEPPEFAVLAPVPLNENFTGPLLTITATDPEGAPVSGYTITEVSKLGEVVNSDRLVAAFSIDASTGELTVNNAFDADIEGTQDPITVTVSASDGNLIGTGGVSLQLVDLPTRVVSGVRIAGESISFPIARVTTDAGDLDADGVTDLLVSQATDGASAETSYLIYGQAIRDEMADGVGDITVADIPAAQLLTLTNDDPNQTERRSTLITTPACDVDGDGSNELLIAFRDPRAGQILDTVDGPLAAIIWGDYLANQTSGTIDLTALTSAQGLLIGGLERRANVGVAIASGNLDGDDRCDLLLGTESLGLVHALFGDAITRGSDIDLATAGSGEVLRIRSELQAQGLIQQIGTRVTTLSGLDVTDAVVIAGAGLEPNFQDGLFIVSGAAVAAAKLVTDEYNVSDAGNAAAVVEMSADADVRIVDLDAGADVSGDGIADLAVGYRGDFMVNKVAALVYSEKITAAFSGGGDPSLVPASAAEGAEITITDQIYSQTLDVPTTTVTLTPAAGGAPARWYVGTGAADSLGRTSAGSVYAISAATLQALADPAISFAEGQFPASVGRQIVGFQANAKLGEQVIPGDIDLDGTPDLTFGSDGIGEQQRLGNSGGVLFVPGPVIEQAFSDSDAVLDLASSVVGEVP